MNFPERAAVSSVESRAVGIFNSRPGSSDSRMWIRPSREPRATSTQFAPSLLYEDFCHWSGLMKGTFHMFLITDSMKSRDSEGFKAMDSIRSSTVR